MKPESYTDLIRRSQCVRLTTKEQTIVSVKWLLIMLGGFDVLKYTAYLLGVTLQSIL